MRNEAGAAPIPTGLRAVRYAPGGRLRLSRVVSVAAAGILILASTACSWPNQPPVAVGTGDSQPGKPSTGPYFYDMAAELAQGWSYDADGIVLTPNGSDLEYNPVDISQYALGYYGLWWTTGSLANRNGFLHYADWLVDHQASSGLWLYTYQVWTMKPPWHSAMAQGQAMSVLIRAWEVTKNEKYLRAATAALQTFSRAYEDNGVAAYEGPDTFYEEYDPSFMPHVLNGFIFALIGLHEYHAAVGDPDSGRFFDVGVATLARNLQRWDAGSWSYYNLASPPDLASGLYAGIHVAQLEEMWRLTGNSTFKTYAERWASFFAPPAASTP